MAYFHEIVILVLTLQTNNNNNNGKTPLSSVSDHEYKEQNNEFFKKKMNK